MPPNRVVVLLPENVLLPGADAVVLNRLDLLLENTPLLGLDALMPEALVDVDPKRLGTLSGLSAALLGSLVAIVLMCVHASLIIARANYG